MSREVRRVPVDWKHPIEHNPYWEFQTSMRHARNGPASQLHGPTERFVALMGDYPSAVGIWEEDLRDMKARKGFSWNFSVEYHLTGHKGRDDSEPTTHPYYVFTEDGEDEIEVTLRDEDHLHELEVAKLERERPDPNRYMPVFDVPEDELGWCLYQTLSEGSPVTPVFATAAELVDHLCTVGQDLDEEPMRRESAEIIVGQGWTIGSMISVDGHFYRSDVDADKIADLNKPQSLPEHQP